MMIAKIYELYFFAKAKEEKEQLKNEKMLYGAPGRHNKNEQEQEDEEEDTNFGGLPAKASKKSKNKQ